MQELIGPENTSQEDLELDNTKYMGNQETEEEIRGIPRIQKLDRQATISIDLRLGPSFRNRGKER
jgi:hypothetical protein